VTYDPKTSVFVESIRFENGDKMIRHGRWDKKSKTLRIELVSLDSSTVSPLANGVRTEQTLRAVGPNEIWSTYTVSGGKDEYKKESVVLRKDKSQQDPTLSFEGKEIETVAIRFVGEKYVDESRLRSIIRVVPGSFYDIEAIDSDIYALYESGLIGDMRVLAETVDEKVNLIYEVAKTTIDPTTIKSDSELPE
jgi:hypothetical protein